MANEQQRVALVTGANKGIGFEVARHLARKGFSVFLGARNKNAGQEAANHLSNEGDVAFLEIDVADSESIRDAAQSFSRRADHLDVLVNNAGVLLDEDKTALGVTSEIFDTTLRTNT